MNLQASGSVNVSLTLRYNSGSNFGNPLTSQILGSPHNYDFVDNYKSNFYGIIPVDHNADGVDDFWMLRKNSTQNSYYYTPYIFSSGIFSSIDSKTEMGLGSADFIKFGDIDGNGKIENISYSSSAHEIRISFADITNPYIISNVDQIVGYANTDKNVQIGEFDGDGKADLYILNDGAVSVYKFIKDASGQYFLSHSYAFGDTPNYHIPYNSAGYSDYRLRLGDFNGDGKTDVLLFDGASNCTILLSTGTDFKLAQTSFSSGAKQNTTNPIQTLIIPNQYFPLDDILITDCNKDGKDEIVVRYKQIVFTGSGSGFGSAIIYNYVTVFENFNFIQCSTASMQIDQSLAGNTLQNINFNGTSASNFLCGTAYYKSSIEYHAIIGVTNGLNVETKVQYKPITDNSVYAKGAISAYPLLTYQKPLNVVYSVKTSDGLNGYNETDYFYADLKIHLRGRGMLGFGSVRITDARTSLYAENNYEYDQTTYAPYLSYSSATAGGQTRSGYTQSKKVINDCTGHARYFYWTSRSTTNKYEDIPGTGGFSNFTGSLSTSTTVDDCGNPTVQTQTTGGTPVWTTTQVNKYFPDNRTTWTFGGLQNTVKTKTCSSNSGNAYSYSESYAYYPDGKLKTTVSAENTPLTSTHTYFYDSFGNPVRHTVNSLVSSVGSETRTVSTVQFSGASGYKFRFPTQTIEIDGRTTTCDYNSLGQPTTKVDLTNNYTVSYNYDIMGRLIQQVESDGSTTNTVLEWVSNKPNIASNAPVNALYYSSQQTLNKDAALPAQVVYYDLLGRKLRTLSTAFDGSTVYTDIVYTTPTSTGYSLSTSLPYIKGNTPEFITKYYDIYGREMACTGPGINTKTEYGINSVTTTNQLSYLSPKPSTCKKIDSGGNLISSTDGGGTITYAYLNSGNLGKIIDPS